MNYSCEGTSQGFLGFDHGLDTVIHVLDEVFLGSSESSLVGNVVGGVDGLGVLSVDSSDLDVPLVGNSLESFFVGRELWQFDVHGCSQGSSQVSWARSDVSQVVVMSELGHGFNVVGSHGKSSEDFSDS